MTVVITPGRRAAAIRVRRLFECGTYSSAATIREQRLIQRIRYASAAVSVFTTEGAKLVTT